MYPLWSSLLLLLALFLGACSSLEIVPTAHCKDSSWKLDEAMSYAKNHADWAPKIRALSSSLKQLELQTNSCKVSIEGELVIAQPYAVDSLRVPLEIDSKTLMLYYTSSQKQSTKKFDFHNFNAKYRSVRKISNRYSYLTITQDRELYFYYDKSYKIASLYATKEGFSFAGRAGREGKLLFFDEQKRLKMERFSLWSEYILDSYKNPNIHKATKLPWTLEAVKKYTQSHPLLHYHKSGREQTIDGIVEVDRVVQYKVLPFKEESFELLDDEKETNYNEKIGRSLDKNSWMISTQKYSKFSPFVNLFTEPSDIVYEVVGREKIDVEAGSFDCIIVYISGGINLKVWMIIDRPGVYAKYLDDYYEYTLVKMN